MHPLVSRAKAPRCSSLFCEYRLHLWKPLTNELLRMNALISITEINSLYDQRPIIEKQASYAFVHPFTEALGGVVADIPVKFVSAVVFNIIFYFLAGLVSLYAANPRKLLSYPQVYRDTNLLNSSSSSSSPSSVPSQCQVSFELWPHPPRPWHKPCPWLV